MQVILLKIDFDRIIEPLKAGKYDLTSSTYSLSIVRAKSDVRYDKNMPVPKKVKAKSATVSWKKLSAKQRAKFSKVEIRYSTSKKFGSYKTVFVSKKKASCKIKGLKKGKTYYFRVRNVRTKSGTRYVSNWSAVRKAKVK